MSKKLDWLFERRERIGNQVEYHFIAKFVEATSP
jgi:hypothetical protein